MKARFNKTTWRAVSGIVASFLLVVTFQNCGKAGFDAELDGKLDLGSEAALTSKYGQSLGKKVGSIPFAYEASVDTISYNSCANAGVKNKTGYFTLKAGAYSTGGISLKEDFYNYVNENFTPVYPETTITQLQYKELLSDSTANRGLTPNLAIRAKGSLTDLPILAGENLALHKHIIPMVGTLTDALVMDSFIHRGVAATYFPFSQEKRVMEATFTLNDNEANAEAYRGYLDGNGSFLTLTYIPEDSEEIYRVASPSSTYPFSSAYGKGYTLDFAQPIGSYSGASERRLDSVYEVDLNAKNSGRPWARCKSYKVIRVADAAIATSQNSYCPAMTQTELANSATYRRELEIVRRHFPASQWDVNVARGCMVPKSQSCYEEVQYAGAPIVEYNEASACRTGRPNDGTNSLNSQCAHYVSVCTR